MYQSLYSVIITAVVLALLKTILTQDAKIDSLEMSINKRELTAYQKGVESRPTDEQLELIAKEIYKRGLASCRKTYPL